MMIWIYTSLTSKTYKTSASVQSHPFFLSIINVTELHLYVFCVQKQNNDYFYALFA